MATNTIVLIVVAALALLVLAATAVAITYKTRTPGRPHTVRDRADKAELRAVYEKAVADDDPATAYAAEAELTDTELRGPRVQPAA
jgi:hypothetical protein